MYSVLAGVTECSIYHNLYYLFQISHVFINDVEQLNEPVLLTVYNMYKIFFFLTLNVAEIHPMTYGQGQEIWKMTTTTLWMSKCPINNWFLFIFPCLLLSMAFKVKLKGSFIHTQRQLISRKTTHPGWETGGSSIWAPNGQPLGVKFIPMIYTWYCLSSVLSSVETQKRAMSAWYAICDM